MAGFKRLSQFMSLHDVPEFLRPEVKMLAVHCIVLEFCTLLSATSVGHCENKSNGYDRLYGKETWVPNGVLNAVY
jgi:hypothetical protein